MDPSVLKQSIKRFISRRGCPNNIINNNDKNFISQETGKFIISIGIKWHLNLPLAPWIRWTHKRSSSEDLKIKFLD